MDSDVARTVMHSELIGAGWIRDGFNFLEPRTGLDFTWIEAGKLLVRHSREPTKPIAAHTGFSQHSDLYTKFGPPERRIRVDVKTKGGGLRSCDISIWFPPEKEVEQFMSQAGHKLKQTK